MPLFYLLQVKLRWDPRRVLRRGLLIDISQLASVHEISMLMWLGWVQGAAWM